MNQQVRRSRWIGLLCALILLAGLIGPLQASRGTLVRAASPELKFTPSKAKAGESVKATGKRLPEDVAGELIWERDGSILATFETDGSGRFKASFVVPQAAGGDYEVAAKIKDESGKVKTEATEELTVLDPPTATAVPPTEAPPTEVPPTSTEVPPPATDVPPTEVEEEATKAAPTNTPEPTNAESTETPTPKATTTSDASPSATTEAGTSSLAALSGSGLSFPIRAAFYYPWFPNAWNQGGVYPYTNFTPSAGYYDGGDPAIIKQHIAAMQYGNIQAGISSWWGQGHHTDVRLPALLAGAAGTGFKWTVYHEEESLGNPTVTEIRDDLTYLRDKYASDPSYLRIDGKFVVFVYADGGDGCGMADRWKQANTVGAYVVLKVFSGYRNCASQPESWHQYAPSTAADSQAGYSYAISPGFWLKGAGVRLGRDLNRWTQNVRDMVASGAPWQLVVSFNEWGEGTIVESAEEWKSASGYGSYLDVLHENGLGAGSAPPPTATPGIAPPTSTASSAPTATAVSGPATSYSLVSSAASVNSAASTYVRDRNLSTVWKTKLFESGPPSSAWVWVDLGSRKPVGTIRWVFGEAGIGDYFVIEGSNNLTDWSYITKRNGKPVGVWQEKLLTRSFRYIRFRFENPNRDRYLGGLAEVQVWSLGSTPPLATAPPTATSTPRPTATATQVPSPVSGEQRPPLPAGAREIVPAADSRVEEVLPSQNFGVDATLQVDSGTGLREMSYLKFTVGSDVSTIVSAKLQLYVRSGTTNGPTVQGASSSWSESTITWSNRPALSGSGIEDKGALAEGTWVEYDVTSLISGSGTYTLALVATSTDGVTFAARDDAPRRPLLILVTDGSAAPSPSPSPTPGSGGEAVLLAAGDVAACESVGDEATALLLDDLSGTIAQLGDAVYNSGTAAEFANCYDPSWGRHKSRVRPAVGNHEYGTSGASGYFNYFGSAAGEPGKGYYSYDLGGWHIVVLNSNCTKVSCSAGSAQANWLAADLKAHPSQCTLAYWHHPLFSSGNHGNSSATLEFWKILYTHGADMVLVGHDHDYERFAPQTPSGGADSRFGIRQFVVGTGGKNLYGFGTTRSNSEVRYNKGFGVLRLVLRDGSYTWEFISEAGKTFTDSGSGSCHGAPSSASTGLAMENQVGLAMDQPAGLDQAVLPSSRRQHAARSVRRRDTAVA